MKVNPNEKRVLEVLAEEYSSDMNCFYFRGIQSRMGKDPLDLKQVRRACRSLAKKGLAQFVRGLFDDDGMVAGSGYCATFEGAMLVNACKDCKKKLACMVTGQCDDCWTRDETKDRLRELESMGVPTGHVEIAKVSLCDIGILKRHYEEKGIPKKMTPASVLALVNTLVKPYQRHYAI